MCANIYYFALSFILEVGKHLVFVISETFYRYSFIVCLHLCLSVFVCVSVYICVCVSVCVHIYKCRCPWNPKEHVTFPRSDNWLQVIVSQVGCLELNSGLMKKQVLLIFELSLHHLFFSVKLIIYNPTRGHLP